MKEYHSNTESELRRQQLLLEAKRRYREQSDYPPVHPRYGLLSEDDTEINREINRSFSTRSILACIIFVAFLTLSYMDYQYQGWNCKRVISAISTSFDIPTWWKSL